MAVFTAGHSLYCIFQQNWLKHMQFIIVIFHMFRGFSVLQHETRLIQSWKPWLSQNRSLLGPAHPAIQPGFLISPPPPVFTKITGILGEKSVSSWLDRNPGWTGLKTTILKSQLTHLLMGYFFYFWNTMHFICLALLFSVKAALNTFNPS